jgi:hypothetical protein
MRQPSRPSSQRRTDARSAFVSLAHSRLITDLILSSGVGALAAPAPKAWRTVSLTARR